VKAHMRITARAALFIILALAVSSYGADSSAPEAQMHLDVSKASPRQVEDLTERGILRDYRLAWTSLTQAMALSALDPLDGPFAGDAKRTLRQTVQSQQHSGLRTRYTGQKHQVEAVFYAPEGDVMELHDTAQYQLQVSDGGKIIHDEPVTMRFVVLMTPGADRWVIRQLQAVPDFQPK
jgi:hypothetical protein